MDEQEGEQVASLFSDLPKGPFEVVLADPPWKYDFTKVTAWGVDVHYPTLTPDQIGSLPVASIVCNDSVLFLWTTSPKLPQGLQVMMDWGFNYRTSFIWDKGGLGMGYYVRVNHEILLIGVKGKPGVPAVPDRPASILRSPRQGHSKKPEAVRQIIERMYPNANRIELFARQRCDGWTSWGLGVQ